MALFSFRKPKAPIYPMFITDIDKLVLYSMPPFSSEAYKPWEDDGKSLDNIYLLVSDSAFGDNEPFDDRGIANSLLAYARAGGYIRPECHSIMLGAGATDADIRKLVVRGAVMLADFRSETIEAHAQGEETLFDYAIFPPGDFSLVTVQKGFAQYHRIVWKRDLNEDQKTLISKCFAARNTRKALGGLSQALKIVIGEYKERISGLDGLLENAQQSAKVFKVASMDYLDDYEIALIVDAVSFATRSRTWLAERMAIADFPDDTDAIATSSPAAMAAQRLVQIAQCWAYGMAMLVMNGTEQAEIIACRNATSLEGILNRVPALGIAAGVDVLVKSVIEDGVSIEHVIDDDVIRNTGVALLQ